MSFLLFPRLTCTSLGRSFLPPFERKTPAVQGNVQICCRGKKTFQRCSCLPLLRKTYTRDDQICAYTSDDYYSFKVCDWDHYDLSSGSQRNHPSQQLHIEVLMLISSYSFKHFEKRCLDRVFIGFTASRNTALVWSHLPRNAGQKVSLNSSLNIHISLAKTATADFVTTNDERFCHNAGKFSPMVITFYILCFWSWSWILSSVSSNYILTCKPSVT